MSIRIPLPQRLFLRSTPMNDRSWAIRVAKRVIETGVVVNVNHVVEFIMGNAAERGEKKYREDVKGNCISCEFDEKEFPNIAPPWPRFALYSRDAAGPNKLADVDEWMLTCESFLTNDDDTAQLEGIEKMPRLREALMGSHFVTYGVFIAYDKHRNEMGYGPFSVLATANKDGSVRKALTLPSNEINMIPDDYIPFSRIVAGNMLSMMLFSLTFANCKNVVHDRTTGESELITDRKWIRRQKVPQINYRTLKIGGMERVLREEGGLGQGNGVKKALHICRGHFAHYTEDKPLFGRVTGTFWKPMHTRGSKEFGEVKKQYDLEPGVNP